MALKTVKVGLVGFGTVGAGVAKILTDSAGTIETKMGLRLELARVVDIDTKSPRPVKLPDGVLTDDLNALLSDSSIEIAVELVGGTGAAKDIQLKLLQAGKDVVTANKALLAEHGAELYAAARANNRCIAFEASCAAGVPIVSALRTGLAANNIEAMYGIVNGTCNYILTNMASKGRDFETALKEAQQKGYAEADPTLDISGGDSAHKLAILASIAFGYEIKLEDVYVEGIDSIPADDLRYGSEMGYKLKLLAIGKRQDNGKVSLRVHPSFIAEDHELATVDGSFNAVSVFGNAVGQVMFYGRGAGMMPTASAVVADIIDVALGNSARTFKHLSLKLRSEVEPLIEKIENIVSRFYIRFMAKDQPGVFAQVGKILADNQVSISGVLQHEGRGEENTVPLVITTHPTQQAKVNACLVGLRKLDTVIDKPVCIRIVDIPEDRD
jgi:homoserine dehydrogenase